MTQEIEGLITNMIDETQDQGQEKNLKKIQTLHKIQVFSFYRLQVYQTEWIKWTEEVLDKWEYPGYNINIQCW